MNFIFRQKGCIFYLYLLKFIDISRRCVVLRTRLGAQKVLCDTGRLKVQQSTLKKDNLSYQQVLDLVQSFTSHENNNSINKTDLIINSNGNNKNPTIKKKGQNNFG